ncbi:hypothetical protein V8C37DRAFT_246642 [Trichoderma ceciliae]
MKTTMPLESEKKGNIRVGVSFLFFSFLCFALLCFALLCFLFPMDVQSTPRTNLSLQGLTIVRPPRLPKRHNFANRGLVPWAPWAASAMPFCPCVAAWLPVTSTLAVHFVVQ